MDRVNTAQIAVPRKVPLIDFSLIESRDWGDKPQNNEPEYIVEGECYLRTRSDKLRKHWAVVIGKDFYCY